MSRETHLPAIRLPDILHRSLEPLASAYRAGSAALGSRTFAVLVCLVCITFVSGAIRPPDNADSLTYHLARVTYWRQYQSVANYITPVDRQLYQPPLSSYGMLLIRMVTNSDRLAFLLQWFAYLGCLVLVYRMAQRWKANGAMAVVFAATIPMALLQASSTQNDLITAFWCCCVVYFILEDAPVYVGISAGMALLTKSTAYILIGPLLLWYAWRMMQARNWKLLIASGLIALSLNAPFYLRSMETFGSPISSGQHDYSNDEISPRVLVSSIARNLELYLPLPGEQITNGVGLDINDMAITWDGHVYPVDRMAFSEDDAAAPFHAAILLVVLVPALMHRRTRVLSLCLVCGFVLFCLLLKWQVWHSRLHLPLLIMWSPVVAAVLPRRVHRWTSILLLTFAFLVLMVNGTRSIPGWFAPPQPRAYEAKYEAFAGMMKITGCRDIYMRIGSSEPEYLMHQKLPDANFTHDVTVNHCATFWSFDTAQGRMPP